MMTTRLALLAASLLSAAAASAGDGNRLTYLEENNPWYPHTGFARLTTPQWVGDDGVESVVILAIDDMRDPAKYEAFLRPILQRLKAIDGRAPLSIMTCNVKPDDPQLQSWLGEGLSIECHTVDHPCPLLQGGDFARAKSTYDRCVDTLNQVHGNTPVAFRTPCCDSLNTVSPRFFAEIFNSRTPAGNFLQMDSSVFCVFTEGDREIPAELVTDPDGKPKFRKYLPKGLKRNDIVHNEFVNWIENYPYPYVINGACWEIPCMAPSDWEANFYHQPNNPQTVRDMETALDITVLKQGVFCMVFHPHGWIRSDQIVEFIDHAVSTHGDKVKFLTFPEALARLNENLLQGQSLRDQAGNDGGVRIVDFDNDGDMDVAISAEQVKCVRVWDPAGWRETALPFAIHDAQFAVSAAGGAAGIATFGTPDGARNVPSETGTLWTFDDGEWKADVSLPANEGNLQTLSSGGPLFWTNRDSVRFRDVDGDGACEVIRVGWTSHRRAHLATQVLHWESGGRRWEPLPFVLPGGWTFRDQFRFDALRFVDLNHDGQLDLVVSDPERFGIWLFNDMRTGWSIEVMSGRRGEQPPAEELPPIVRKDGTDNGFFIHSGYLLWQNEDTANLPDMVEKRSIAELLRVRPE